MHHRRRREETSCTHIPLVSFAHPDLLALVVAAAAVVDFGVVGVAGIAAGIAAVVVAAAAAAAGEEQARAKNDLEWPSSRPRHDAASSCN